MSDFADWNTQLPEICLSQSGGVLGTNVQKSPAMLGAASSSPYEAGMCPPVGPYLSYATSGYIGDLLYECGLGRNLSSKFVKGFQRPLTTPAHRPLRIGHINAALLPAGIESWLSALIKEADPRRLKFVRHVSFGPLVDPRQIQRLGIPVEIGGRSSVKALAADCDILLISDPGSTPEIIAEWIAEGPRPVIVFVAHGDAEYTARSLRAFALLVDHVIAVSEHVQRTVCEDLKSTVIRNGVDPTRLCPTQSASVTRQALGFVDEDFVVGFVGRFSTEKNPHLLISAVSTLPSNVKLLLVGFGHLRQRLLDDCLRLLPGRFVTLEADDCLGDLFAAMDAHCLPSSYEGYGLATMEAMMCGVPVITTNFGLAPELIQTGYNGLIIEPTVHDISKKLLALSSRRDWARQMGDNGRRTAMQHGYASSMARSYESVLEEIWVNRRTASGKTHR